METPSGPDVRNRNRSHRDARAFDIDRVARAVSAGATGLLLLLVAHGLTSLPDATPARPQAALVLSWVDPPPSRAPALPAPTSEPAPQRVRTPRIDPTPVALQPADAAPAAAPVAPALDYGALLAPDASIVFAERPVGQRDRYRTAFDAPPERFRMRRAITPEDVVRGFAQLVGLWPPGYTDSPCPAIRGLIETTPEVPSPRELALLQDAVLARERFCT